MIEETPISIIIPAYDEEGYISDTIESIGQQEYSNKEVIIVANGCKDGTAGVSRDILSGYRFNSKVLELKDRGISLAKNKGFKESDGKIIVTLDADTLMGPELLDEINKSLYETVYAGGKVKIKPRLEGLSKRQRAAAKLIFGYANLCNDITIRAGNGFDYFKDKQSGAGACFFLTKEVSENIKKAYGDIFNEEMETMEDVDFTKRLMEQEGMVKFLKSAYVETHMRRYIKGGGFWPQFLQDFKEYRLGGKREHER